MYALVSPEKIQLPAGSVVRLLATWQDYEKLYSQRGKGSLPRIKYRNGEILLMSPMPVHGRDAHVIAQAVVILLEHSDLDYSAFTPITLTLPEKSGIEPDYCFYIDNCQAVSGKDRIDWQTEPPPDLVIEVDVTSYSDVNDYLPYRVPEVWLWRKQKLLIHQLSDDRYQLQEQSRYFPEMDLSAIMTRCVQIAGDRTTSAAIRDLRQQLNAG
jgi:Uma2 family endonuclease